MDLNEMSLTEKNNLYVKQKREIEHLKRIIAFYETHQINNASVKEFVNTNCISDHSKKVKALDLFTAYLQWCEKYNLQDATKKEFYSFIYHFGFNKKRGSKNCLYFYGIDLKEGHANAPKKNM